MKCDEIRKRVDGGDELTVETHEHMDSCASCREEFASLRALRAFAPEPPAGLRDRVLESAFPVRRSFGWQLAAAAAIAIAFTGGLLAGRGSITQGNVVTKVERVVVEKEKIVLVEKAVETPKPADGGDLFVLALALQMVYEKQVSVEFDGMSCTSIKADKSVLEMIQCCPIARKLWVAASERPDVVAMQK